MRRPGLLFRIYCFLIGFSILGTLASRKLSVDPGPVAPAASILIIGVAVWIVAIETASWQALVATAVIASALEMCSLFTGFPFGVYEYSSNWIPTVPVESHRFPLLLPGAWILLVWGSYLWARQFVGGWQAIGATATLAMVIDIPLERAMTEVFRYWTWASPGPLFGAPITNSLGWFLTALLCAVPFRSIERPRNAVSPQVLALFCLFVAASGLMAFWDWAWPLLAFIGCVMLVPRKFLPVAVVSAKAP